MYNHSQHIDVQTNMSIRGKKQIIFIPLKGNKHKYG